MILIPAAVGTVTRLPCGNPVVWRATWRLWWRWCLASAGVVPADIPIRTATIPKIPRNTAPR